MYITSNSMPTSTTTTTTQTKQKRKTGYVLRRHDACIWHASSWHHGTVDHYFTRHWHWGPYRRGYDSCSFEVFVLPPYAQLPCLAIIPEEMSREFEYFIYVIEGLAAGENMPNSFLFISPCNCVCVPKCACYFAGLAGCLHFGNARSLQILSLSFYSRRNDLSNCRSHAPWGLSSRRWRYRNGRSYVQLSY